VDGAQASSSSSSLFEVLVVVEERLVAGGLLASPDVEASITRGVAGSVGSVIAG
jgi:hypothetical protein